MRERQVQAVKSALSHLENALQPNLPIELVAEELRRAARNIGKLIGEAFAVAVTESPFCCQFSLSHNLGELFGQLWAHCKVWRHGRLWNF